MRKLWIGLIFLILLSPLGLYLPAKFGAGSAWGEWSAEEISKMVGFVPSGLGKLQGLWKAPMPDYALRGQKDGSSISYILSAIIGVAVVAGLTIFLGRVLARKEDSSSAS